MQKILKIFRGFLEKMSIIAGVSINYISYSFQTGVSNMVSGTTVYEYLTH